MADTNLQLSNVVVIAALVLVVVGLVIAIFFYFKRAENLTDEDRLNIERVKIAWTGAIALGVLTLVAARKEKGMPKSSSGRSGAGRSSPSMV